MDSVQAEDHIVVLELVNEHGDWVELVVLVLHIACVLPLAALSLGLRGGELERESDVDVRAVGEEGCQGLGRQRLRGEAVGIKLEESAFYSGLIGSSRLWSLQAGMWGLVV